ncbi:MAG: WYL domain-containing protein [Cyanobacteria bacterium SIG29]|nr:WYL domain-containing protein [Cyanobacteria bacterium SIG29]
MKKSDKNFDTGLRILEVLKALLNENLKKIELIEKLKVDGKIDNVSTLEAFIKYFNTLEIMGFELEKVKNIYALKNALYQVDVTNEEKNLLSKIIEDNAIFRKKSTQKHLKSAISKMNKYFNSPFSLLEIDELFKKEVKVEYDEVKEKLIHTISNFIEAQLLVKIIYKKNNGQNEKLTVELKELLEKNERIFVLCYCPSTARNKKIAIDKIVSLSQLPRKSQGTSCLNSVIFELYGRLANSYKLKPSEKVIDFGTNKITVSNSEEDREILLHRLLKYGDNCKLISPKEMKKELLDLTKAMLKNLEGK